MHKIIIILFATAVLSHVSHASPVNSQEFSDDGSVENNEMNLAREEDSDEDSSTSYPTGLVEEIKSRILKSLHKTEAPKHHVPLPDLQKLHFRNVLAENRTANENNITASGKTKTDFLPAYVGE